MMMFLHQVLFSNNLPLSRVFLNYFFFRNRKLFRVYQFCSKGIFVFYPRFSATIHKFFISQLYFTFWSPLHVLNTFDFISKINRLMTFLMPRSFNVYFYTNFRTNFCFSLFFRCCWSFRFDVFPQIRINFVMSYLRIW